MEVKTEWEPPTRLPAKSGLRFGNGIITEVYYPTVDRPQLRDLQYLITDGKTFFHEEKRHLKSQFERLSDHSLGYRCTNSDPKAATLSLRKLSRTLILPAFSSAQG